MGIGVSQMSASSPIWCEAWPVSIGPPRGCEMSPIKQARPAIGRRVARQFLDQLDHRRMAPAPVARQAHRLPGRAVGGDRDAAGKAALAVEADRMRAAVAAGSLSAPNRFLASSSALPAETPAAVNAASGAATAARRRGGSKERSHRRFHGRLSCPKPGPRWLPEGKRRTHHITPRRLLGSVRAHRAARVALACALPGAVAHMRSKAER